MEFISKHGGGSREFSTDKVDTLATDKDGHIVDNYGAARHEVNKECRENLIAANRRPLCSTATCHETNEVKKSKAQQGMKTGHREDDRMITAEQLLGKVKETNNLSPEQQGELYKVLMNYQPHLTKRPGRCTVFEYEFIVEGGTPRLITFATLMFESFHPRVFGSFVNLGLRIEVSDENKRETHDIHFAVSVNFPVMNWSERAEIVSLCVQFITVFFVPWIHSVDIIGIAA